jgi:hypothetical protein
MKVNTMILRMRCVLLAYCLEVFPRHSPVIHPIVPTIYPMLWNIMWNEYHSLLNMGNFLKYLAIITPMGRIVPHPIMIKTICTCSKLKKINLDMI